MKRILPFLILINLNFTQFAFAQNRTIDSLFTLLKVLKNDTGTVNRLNALSWEFRNENPDTAFFFAKKALNIATKLNYPFGIADAKLKIGSALLNLGESEKALSNLNEALIIFDKLFAKNIFSERKKLIKAKSQTINGIGWVYIDKQKYNLALPQLLNSLKLSHSILYKKGMSYSCHTIGFVYFNLSNCNKALNYLYRALKLKQELNDEKTIAFTYILIGCVYEKQGRFSDALKINFQSLKLCEKIKDSVQMSQCYNNIGIIYETQKNYQEAIKYHQLSLKLKLKSDNKSEIATSYQNIGSVYLAQGNYDKAIEYYQIAIQSAQKVNDKTTLTIIYNNIAYLYFEQNRIKDALEVGLIAVNLSKEIGEKYSEASLTNIIAKCYLKLRVLNKAKFYAAQNLSLAKEIGSLETYRESYTLQTEVDSSLGNYKQALEYYKLSIIYRDSIENKENTKKIVEAQMNYDFDKKQTADSIKVSADKKVLHAQIAQQKTQRNGFVVGFALVLLLAGFIFRNYKQKQKANLLLEEKNIAITSQKEVIEEQKKTVEVKQKQIVDSINYAKRIQESILIPEQTIQQHLPNSFVLFLPRDIVSGDFYWFHQQDNQSIVVCADCTGHGVPGAFLSMVGSTLLNEIVVHKKITDPANIMKQLAAGVSDTLKHKEKDEMDTDGMDISICTFSNKELHFAAANNPIYVVNQKGLQEIEPQVNSINGIFEMNVDEKIDSITLSPEAGSMIYMSTDGFADQPGQATKKKLYSAGFEKMLIELHHLPLQEQKEKLATFFNEWRGNLKQHDDILVMGIRV